MAQYGKNFYGTSYYGETNVFSGWYETKEIPTDEALTGPVTVKMLAELPKATYGPTAKEVRQVKGVWVHDANLGKISTAEAGAELLLKATSDEIVIKYEQRTAAPTVTIEVTTIQPGKPAVVRNLSLNSQGTSVNANATYTITNLPFGEQRVRLVLPGGNPATSLFHFKGFTARTANVILEARARTSSDPALRASDYKQVPLTITALTDGSGKYNVTGSTLSYAGKTYIQYRIFLGSSDDATSPIVHSIESTSGNTANRTEDGQWSALFNMEEVARLAGQTFAKVEEVTWTEEVPASTKLTVRSMSSTDNNLVWDKMTVPYKLNSNRIRLKEGRLRGWIDAPLVAPSSGKPNTSTLQWDSWDDRSYLPPDSGGVAVTYRFLNTTKTNEANPYHRINNPMNVANRTLGGTGLRNLDHYVRIQLERTAEKQTPVVDFINLKSYHHYQQDVEITNQEFSAVDSDNTGKRVVLDMTNITWQNQFIRPSEVTLPTYTLIDKTGRPQDVMLFLDTEKDAVMRTNSTLVLNNKVWAEAKVQTPSSKTGLIKHYQYGGGQVKFPLKEEIRLAPVFTPSLKQEKRYRYYLDNGWSTQYHVVLADERMEDIAELYEEELEVLKTLNPKASYNNNNTLVSGQRIELPNNTANPDILLKWESTNNLLTQKSSHNARAEQAGDLISDAIVAEVSEASTYGWVDWVSDERIYPGVINLNDTRMEYKRSHRSPESGDSAQIEYMPLPLDTFKSIATRFGVYEEDIRILNSKLEGEPIPGQPVRVPSLITLPAIHPRAAVEDNPYMVEIVYNSVKKKNGKILPSHHVVVKPLEITYKTVTMRDVEIQRGEIANGKDVLLHPRVVSILKAQNRSKTRTYNIWNETLKTGDFKKDYNYIDWSPASSPASEPALNEIYLVDYTVEVPDKVIVTIDTTYREEGGVDRVWRSPEVKEYKGMCYPGQDYVTELPAFSEWEGLPDSSVEDLEYIIEDNDLWVKTWVEKRNGKNVAIGSLQDRVPKSNWLPTIESGYYYLGKEEFYLFSEPVVVEPSAREIPIAENVEYVEGKFQNAVRIEQASENLVANSGFQQTDSKQVIFKLTF